MSCSRQPTRRGPPAWGLGEGLINPHCKKLVTKYLKHKKPFVFCGSLAVRKEHRCWVFENRVLRRIFGPKRKEVTGGLKSPYNEKLHNLKAPTNIIGGFNQGE
jgi:hypothetical protein